MTYFTSFLIKLVRQGKLLTNIIICINIKEEWAIKSEFYTLKGYKLKENNNITEAMEDYLEMIYRNTKKNQSTKVNELAKKLNVKPSSVSKMANRLKTLNLIEFEKYSEIKLTNDGFIIGKYLLWRHNVLKEFFMSLNKEHYKLEQVEKIEHFIDYETLNNLEKFNSLIN